MIKSKLGLHISLKEVSEFHCRLKMGEVASGVMIDGRAAARSISSYKARHGGN